MDRTRSNPCFENWDAATLLQVLCQDCPEAVCIVDAETRFSYVNERMARRFGYAFDELCEQPVALVLPPEERDTNLQRLEALLHGEEVTFPRVVSLQNKNGELLPTQVIARPLQKEDGSRHVIATLVDMRATLKLEKLRNEAERVVRHDMKSPLTALMGFANSLLQDESLGQAQRTKVQYIQEVGQKLFYLLNHTMDLFRMEEGSYTLEPKEYNLVRTLGNVLAEVSHLAGRKDVDVQVRLDGRAIDPRNCEQALLLKGEEPLVQSMLANLLNNALEASPHGAPLQIELNETPQGVVELAMHNQGAVPLEIRDRFFEKFVTAGKKYGSGIGTYSARLIARAHKGDIAMQTDDASGTRITVTLPKDPDLQHNSA